MRFVIIHALAAGSAPAFEAARTKASELTGSVQALRYPPHVTLRTGLICPDELAETVAQDFLAHAALAKPARAWTSGLRHELYLPDHGLVALNVSSDGSLDELHQYLLDFTPWSKGPQAGFHPHLTLAYDDLDAEGTRRLADYFAEPEHALPEFSFTVDAVSLYRKTPERWVEFGHIAL